MLSALQVAPHKRATADELLQMDFLTKPYA